jgi:hypothetical protein
VLLLAGCSGGSSDEAQDPYYNDLTFGTALDYSTATCAQFDGASEPDQLATSRAVLNVARSAAPADGTDSARGPTNKQIRGLTDVTTAVCPAEPTKALLDVQGDFLTKYPDDYLVP